MGSPPGLEVAAVKKAIVVALVSVLVLGAALGTGLYYVFQPTQARQPHTTLGRFDSPADFIAALKNGQKSQYRGAEGGMMTTKSLAANPAPAAETAGAPAHSTTNVQVAGVDEADIVKNDGKYIYAISGRSLFIVAAYPAEEARVVSRTDFEENASISEMFINGAKLVVMGASGSSPAPEGKAGAYRPATSFIKVFDVSDPAKPRVLRTVEYEGSYSTARMLDSNVHVVLTTYPYYTLDGVKDLKPSDVIPLVRDTREGQKAAAFEPAAGYRDVEVIDPQSFSSFLSIVSLSLADGSGGLNKRVIAGYSDNVFASTASMYVASAQYPFYGDWAPVARGNEKTTVYKFDFKGPSTKFVGAAEVPGTTLNQFSMDEAGGFFRIATTVGEVSREGSSATNNVYILSGDMKMAGRLEGLAPGEKIYSVRFMGPRAYLVTFKKVDPLFVLDLANPTAPRVLGELKIPGFSDYLHPYDETHVIGVGKNTVEAGPEEEGNFAWYQGMKLAIFDVSDVANPREMHKVEIGDRGTDSYALSDHKAFLFDREKNLLVLPVLLAELSGEQKAAPDRQANDYGSYTYQGAYVYNVSLEGGFALKGRITHVENPAEMGRDYGYGYYGAADSVRRSLYIGSNLYTVSEAKVKVNRLSDLGEVATVRLQ